LLALGALTLDPFNDANDLGIEGEVVFAIGHPEKAASFVVAHARLKRRTNSASCSFEGGSVRGSAGGRFPTSARHPQLLCFRSKLFPSVFRR
jgi:hypothetical protein